MRQVGQRAVALPATWPSAAALRAAAVHQATGQSLASVATTGIVQGVYRFSSHDAMNRHSDEALARAILITLGRRSRQA